MQRNDPMFDDFPLDEEESKPKRTEVILSTPEGKSVAAKPSNFDAHYDDGSAPLNVFKSFLSPSGKRDGFSNILDLWDLIPRFAAEGYNGKDGSEDFPNSITRYFEVGGNQMRIVQMPGYYTKKSGGFEEKGRRYPGYTESLVEQALIKLASDTAYQNNEESDGKTPLYSLVFSLGDIQRVLKSLGASRNKRDIKCSLEVLSNSQIVIWGTVGDSNTLYQEQTSFITNLRWLGEPGAPASAGIWSATLNRIITQGIVNLGYRQYHLDEAKGLRYCGLYVYRKLLVEKLNLSTERGLSFRLKTIQHLTFGLDYKQIYKAKARLSEEIEKMVSLGIISCYDVLPITDRSNSSRRPRVIDYEYTVYPSDRTLGRMKAASAKTRAGAEILGKDMSDHNARRFQLPLSFSDE